MWDLKKIEKLIEDVPDFPKKGIIFKDITPIFENHEAFISMARHFVKTIHPEVRKLVAMESRGFIIGAAVAQHLDVGLVVVRKPGKLPREVLAHSYQLEYGNDTLEIHKDSIQKGDKIAIIDDVLATGGTAMATTHLCKELGAEIMGYHFLLTVPGLNGEEALPAPVHSLL